jgi:hypothetical protein
MEYVEHQFGPGQTISGVIFLKNDHNCSEQEKVQLIEEFNKLNFNRVPRLGEVFKIPVLDKS